MSDIVERLCAGGQCRDPCDIPKPGPGVECICYEAAVEIEQLRNIRALCIKALMKATSKTKEEIEAAPYGCACEAADEIERLRRDKDDLCGWVARLEAEVERLMQARAALEQKSASLQGGDKLPKPQLTAISRHQPPAEHKREHGEDTENDQR